MKNKELKKLVKDAIAKYMIGRMAFTSLDICNYLRSENPLQDIRMKNVSELVRKNTLEVSVNNVFMYEANYIKIDSDKSTLTYLYHHIDFDINNYLSRDQVTLQTK